MPFSTIPKGSILRLKKKLRTKLKPKKITIQLNIQKNIENLDMLKEVTKPPIHRLILASSKRLGIETYKKKIRLAQKLANNKNPQFSSHHYKIG